MKFFILVASLGVTVSCLAEFIVYAKPSGIALSRPVCGVRYTDTEVVDVNGNKLAVTEDVSRLGIVEVPPGTLPVKNISELPSSEETTFDAAQAYTDGVVDSLVTSVLDIASYYGVVDVPINWFEVDAAIEAASQSEDETVALRAIKDGIRLNKNALFLKEWGEDLFNITGSEL